MRLSDIPYGVFSALRNWLYDRAWFSQYQSALPIICVGNISVGGNGKTPLVVYICDLLKRSGKTPVILSRGYGGKTHGPKIVGLQDGSELVGDEPLMLKAKTQCPVVVARKRVEGAKYIERECLGDVIVLDDGFQHRALRRNLDIICAYFGSKKAIRSFQQARQLPFGRFREAKQAALNRAQALMFNSRSLQPVDEAHLVEVKKVLPNNLEIFQSNLSINEIISLDGKSLQKGQTVLVDAFCGLAQPEAFFESLESFGCKICKRYEFKDHHNFSQAQLQKIIKDSAGRPIICSEKDAVKLNLIKNGAFFVAKVSLLVEPKDKFASLILSAIQSD